MKSCIPGSDGWRPLGWVVTMRTCWESFWPRNQLLRVLPAVTISNSPTTAALRRSKAQALTPNSGISSLSPKAQWTSHLKASHSLVETSYRTYVAYEIESKSTKLTDTVRPRTSQKGSSHLGPVITSCPCSRQVKNLCS
jgi:hypothetical protein